MNRPSLSLHARALAWLAQREHSRSELRRKLLRLVRQQVQRAQAEGLDSGVDAAAAAAGKAQDIEALLDGLEARGHLSEQRFVESRVRLRASGQGTVRIQMELARHGLKLEAQPLQALRDSELQRAQQLWQRRFGHAPSDPRERARQMRFLAGRGFGGDVVRRVMASADVDEADDTA